MLNEGDTIGVHIYSTLLGLRRIEIVVSPLVATWSERMVDHDTMVKCLALIAEHPELEDLLENHG